MKALIILLLILSLLVGVTINIYGWITLYGLEFSEPISAIKSGNYTISNGILWILLLVSHLALISLFFLTEKAYFKDLLIWVPLSFVLIFIVNSFLSFLLLIPFVSIWIIALIKQRGVVINLKIGTKTLIIIMVAFSIIIGNPANSGLISLFNFEFSTPISMIKESGYSLSMLVLWIALLLSHLLLIGLMFFPQNNYFKKLLLWIPALFIGIFVVFQYFSFFLLIPFIIVWVIALIKNPQKASSLVI